MSNGKILIYVFAFRGIKNANDYSNLNQQKKTFLTK